MGLYNQVRDIDLLRTHVVMPQSIYYEPIRDAVLAILGVGANGEVPLGPVGTLHYELQVGTLNFGPDSGTVRTIESFGFLTGTHTVDVSRAVAAALVWRPPLDGLRLSGTVFQTKFAVKGYNTTAFDPPDGSFSLAGTPLTLLHDQYTMYVGSLEYRYGNLLLAAEFKKITTDYHFRQIDFQLTTHGDGYYVAGSYRIMDLFEVGLMYDVNYPDSDDRDGETKPAVGLPKFDAWQKNIVLSLRFDVTPNWLLKVEGHLIDGVGNTFPIDNPNGRERNWQLLALKTTYGF
jgi:hypothetical protein